MLTGPELLAAILDDPASDALREAYATFLELEGDIRCEHIRLQLFESAARRAGERADSQVRHAAQLLRAHGASWASAVRPLVDEITFIRGFVDKVRLEARAFLDRGAAIFAVAPVMHVQLTGVRGLTAALAASPHLARLRSLSLARTGLDDAGLIELVASPHLGALRWLDLSGNQLRRPALEALCASPGLPRLTFVNLTRNPCPNPCDLPVVDYDGLPRWEPGDPALQTELEARHGVRPWLHFRTLAPWFYPPAEDQLP